MRWLIAVAVLAGCGTEDGTLLTIRAPDGPDHVARLEIVLASADDQAITTIDDQRVAPNDVQARERVRYYRQRATAGVMEGVGTADGFTVRLEPNLVMVPEKTFVPFLVAYDAQDNVVGVGAVLGVDGEPTTIQIESASYTRQYFVDMVALKPMDPALGMGERESLHVRCGSNAGPWTSGIAWRPGATQLRLLLPDLDEDPAATDASERDADLDCDGFVAPSQDCDDLRAAFNVGRQDVCDGVDSNCDGAATIVQSCGGTSCTSGAGVQLCDDRTGQPTGTCTPTAACACEAGTCNKCVFSYKNTSDATRRTLCAPGVGRMKFPQCIEGAACTIEVLPAAGAWRGFIAATPTSGFGTKITNVTTGEAYLEAKYALADVVQSPGDSIGALYLLVTQGGQSRLVSVDLELTVDGAVTTCPSVNGTGTFVMICSP